MNIHAHDSQLSHWGQPDTLEFPGTQSINILRPGDAYNHLEAAQFNEI